MRSIFKLFNPRYCYIFKNRLAPFTSRTEANGQVVYTFDKPFEAPVKVIRFHTKKQLDKELKKLGDECKGMFAYVYESRFNRPTSKQSSGKKHTYSFSKPFNQPLEKFVI